MLKYSGKYPQYGFWSISFLILARVSIAQDIHLSQFFNTPLLRNPALAGVFTGDFRIQSVYRNQWQSIGFPYQTHALSTEYKFSVGQADDYMTIGGSAFYDMAGVMKLKTIQIMPAINFHKSLSGHKMSYLSGGFMAGFINRQFDGQNLTFDNQYVGGRFDPSAASGENFTGLTRSFLDVATGLSYNGAIQETGAFYVGASYWHFNKPVLSFLSDAVVLDPKWQMNAGLRLPLSEYTELTTEVNWLKQGAFSQTMAGGVLRYNLSEMANLSEEGIEHFSVGIGAFVRLQDAIIPYIEIRYNHWDVGLSYDVNTSPLKAASQGRGGFELSLGYRIFTRNHHPQLRSLRCPRF